MRRALWWSWKGDFLLRARVPCTLSGHPKDKTRLISGELPSWLLQVKGYLENKTLKFLSAHGGPIPSYGYDVILGGGGSCIQNGSETSDTAGSDLNRRDGSGVCGRVLRVVKSRCLSRRCARASGCGVLCTTGLTRS